jgi:hypothetical protein
MRSAQVAYAVLSFGRFLGIGEKPFAVRWSSEVHTLYGTDPTMSGVIGGTGGGVDTRPTPH